ncbi:MAG: hypothetical protein ACK5MZ_01280 [Aestuariibaculum sp.]
MKLKINLWLLATILPFVGCFGQNTEYTPYKIGVIPNKERFEKLTERERIFAQKKEQYNAKKFKMMEENHFIIDSLPHEKRQKYILHKKAKTQKYADNRSRYFLKTLKNDIIEQDIFSSSQDTISTECNCYVSNDTIHAYMDIWVFSGFSFRLKLTQKTFTSSYWAGTHDQSIYKLKLTDGTLTDNVSVSNQKQTLILKNAPTFTIGEEILGHLTFKTEDYYRVNDYESGMAKYVYSDSNMDKINLTGTIYFTCRLREKSISDR